MRTHIKLMWILLLATGSFGLCLASPRVEFQDSQLNVAGKPFFFTCMWQHRAPAELARECGCNSIRIPMYVGSTIHEKPALARCAKAVKEGLWLVPGYAPAYSFGERRGQAVKPAEDFGKAVANFPLLENVLYWDVGDDYNASAEPVVRAAVQAMRHADPNKKRPYALDTSTGNEVFSRHVEMVSNYIYPLFDGCAFSWRGYRGFLRRYRQRAEGGLFWTWIQTHLQLDHSGLLYGASWQDPKAPVPWGPDPEQIRLVVYAALQAGARGLGYFLDVNSMDEFHGQDRRAGLALLNAELAVLGETIAGGTTAQIQPTSHPDVDVGIIHYKDHSLALVAHFDDSFRFVPGPGQLRQVSFAAANVPQGARAYRVTMMGLERLPTDETGNGLVVTLPTLDLAESVLITANQYTVDAFDAEMKKEASRTAKLACRLAHHRIRKVDDVLRRLRTLGHIPAPATGAMELARTLGKNAEQALARRQFGEAYESAMEACVEVRRAQRICWTEALEVGPVKYTLYNTDFYALDRHWQLMDRLADGKWGPNLLANPSFEDTEGRVFDGWQTSTQYADPEEALDVGETVAHGGRHSLVLSSRAPTRYHGYYFDWVTHEVSQTVEVPVGSIVRVSAWVKVPEDFLLTERGAIFSSGGMTTGHELMYPDATYGWKHCELIREAVPDPEHTDAASARVRLGICGIGRVYFDDVEIRVWEPDQ